MSAASPHFNGNTRVGTYRPTPHPKHLADRLVPRKRATLMINHVSLHSFRTRAPFGTGARSPHISPRAAPPLPFPREKLKKGYDSCPQKPVTLNSNPVASTRSAPATTHAGGRDARPTNIGWSLPLF